jgi:hypothetical protein
MFEFEFSEVQRRPPCSLSYENPKLNISIDVGYDAHCRSILGKKWKRRPLSAENMAMLTFTVAN